MHTRRSNIRAALLYQRHIAIPHRMRHYHERQRKITDAFCRYLRQRRERGAHHGNGGDTQCFEFGRVTRGPRG